MVYRWWHPMAVSLGAIAVKAIVPEPWRSLIGTAATLFILLMAWTVYRQASILLDDAIRMRRDARDMLASVVAYRDQVTGADAERQARH